MAVASGVAVANLYYNQPMLADMARSLHTDSHRIGYVATATQVGYAAGMPLFIPLSDFVERRKLIVCLFVAVAVALGLAAVASTLFWLVAASFLIGATTVIAQILIPFSAELATPEQQGRTIGTILSGVLLGILLARTLSGVVSHHVGWRVMFWLAAGMSVVFAAILAKGLPAIHARTNMTYARVMHSLWILLREIPKLRQVCFVAGMFFASFSVFWTTLVFLLVEPPFHMGSQAAGLFGLVGAVGASVAPVAGRLADSRSPRFVVRLAIVIVLAAFGVFWAGMAHLWALVLGVVLLDAGVQAAQVANQTRVFQLEPGARSRINTVYMIGYFGGGSLGSLLGSWMWSTWHWPGVCITGIGLMILAAIGLLIRGPEEVNRSLHLK
jgi:predicted MFS family arabinose efflux permease